MTDIQEDKTSMGLGVRSICKKFEDVYGHVPEMISTITLFNNAIDDILSVQAIQELDRSGITISKANLGENAISSAIKIRKAITSYAALTENPLLLKNVNFTENDLRQSRDVMLYQRTGLIYEAADSVIAHLSPYGILPADLTAFQTLRLGYLAIIPEPRIAIVVKASATQLLVTKFRTLAKILRKLDLAVPGFEAVSPDFASQYKGARIIVSTGHRSSGSKNIIISGTIRHFETLALLPGAVVTVIETGQTMTVGADAKFRFELQAAGIYTLQVSLDGYETYTEDAIDMQPGSHLDFDIELEPEEV
jgi:hypothetical protein